MSVDNRLLMNKTNGVGASGYTLEAHTFVSGNAMADYTMGTGLGYYTDNGDGTYSYKFTSSDRIVIVAYNASGTAFYKLPVQDDDCITVDGDNRPDIPPDA